MGICRGRLRLRGRCSHVSQVECWRCVEAGLLLLVPGGAVFVGVVAGVAGAQLLAVRLEPAHAHQLVPGHALSIARTLLLLLLLLLVLLLVLVTTLLLVMVMVMMLVPLRLHPAAPPEGGLLGVGDEAGDDAVPGLHAGEHEAGR